MKFVLLSGGSGKRLWPLSNESRSKQFLKILQKDNDEFESMLQRVWRQLKEVNLDQSAYIASSKAQTEIIRNQLGNEVRMITEPARRDTFPAVCLAASYLYSMNDVNRDEVIVVLPVDVYVERSFFHRLIDLEKPLRSDDYQLVLLGVKPTYPSEKYGYIVPVKLDEENEWLRVHFFKEKPTMEVAEQLIRQNAFWNCGVFAFKLGYMISLLEDKGFPIHYDELVAQYRRLPKNSFDYEVVEKEEDMAVMPYDSTWKDLGTWNTLTAEMKTRQLGKGFICDDCENTHLINELGIPVTILGLSNTVVAACPDGILVADKKSSVKIKDAMKGIKQRPMYEERRWGWYRVLDYFQLDDGNEVLTKRICIAAGKNLSYQQHFKRSETWTIVRGKGEFVINDKIKTVIPGDVLQIPVGTKHAIKAESDLEFIEVQMGSELIEEDMIRIAVDWEEILRQCVNV